MNRPDDDNNNNKKADAERTHDEKKIYNTCRNYKEKNEQREKTFIAYTYTHSFTRSHIQRAHIPKTFSLSIDSCGMWIPILSRIR